MTRHTDRRYRLQKWQRVRMLVLKRDGWMCRVVAGCLLPATVADHIIPVSEEMPDSVFFNLGNLRAACRTHNIARGWAEHLQPSVDAAVVSKDYS